MDIGLSFSARHYTHTHLNIEIWMLYAWAFFIYTIIAYHKDKDKDGIDQLISDVKQTIVSENTTVQTL